MTSRARSTVLSGGLLAALCALPAAGAGTSPPMEIVYTLTASDAILTRADLRAVLGDDELPTLRAYALDPSLDFGVRLRATRALPHFCADQPVQCRDAILAVFANINASPEPTGQKVLRLRAAIEALAAARTGVPADHALLVDHLRHPSRDLRIASARALRDLCDRTAIRALRQQYAVEPLEPVRRVLYQVVSALEKCGP